MKSCAELPGLSEQYEKEIVGKRRIRTRFMFESYLYSEPYSRPGFPSKSQDWADGDKVSVGEPDRVGDGEPQH